MILQLHKKYVMAMLPFLTEYTNDETFNELFLCCSEVNLYSDNYPKKVQELVIRKRKDRAAEKAVLYGRRGTVFLNHTIGNTNMLVADRVILTEWDEWER